MFNESHLELVRDHLQERGESIAVAESVTAGLLSCAIAQARDASCFFQGGIVAYNLGQKVLHLGVEPIHASACDCVSEKTAAEMARNVALKFFAQWGIAVTGYAAKTKNVKRPYALYAITHLQKVVDAGRIESRKDEGWNTQKYFVSVVLDKLVTMLVSQNVESFS